MSECNSMEAEEVDVEKLKGKKLRTPKTKTKSCKNLDVDSNFPSKNRLKGILLSATKPSYILKKGVGKSRPESETLRFGNRNRLRYILRKLVSQYKWEEASGVLSVLLKGTCNEKSISNNRNKYWATMEVLKHMKGESVNPKKIQNVYELWMKRIGPMKNWPIKDKFAVQLDFILFCLTRGNLDDALQAVIGLMQERDFGSDPTSNFIVGLTFYQLSYNHIRKKLLPSGREMEESPAPPMSKSFQSRRFFDQSIENSDAVHDPDSPTHCDSNTSVRNDKENIVVDQEHKVDPIVKREILSGSNDIEESSLNSHRDSGDIPNASIFHAHGLEPSLLPISFRCSDENLEEFIYLQRQIHNNDYYVNAVKYLSLALHSSPPLFEAILPLIQMLLIGDKVKVALEELEKVIHNSELALPLRVKARILEIFYGNNYFDISTCYEEILKRDPTCNHSLSRLVNMHDDGTYNIEKLVEMIALHLDATKGDNDIWKEFTSSFLKITQCEQDHMSDNRSNDDYTGENAKRNLANSDKIRIPDLLLHRESCNSWRFRCKWWLTRHFSPNILLSDIATGNLEVLTYKAAAASHLYGRENEYVVKAFDKLVKDKNKEMSSFLQIHMQNSVGLCTFFIK